MAKPTELAPAAGDWRLDFRLIDQLPEDSVIGQRFVANAVADSVVDTGRDIDLNTKTNPNISTDCKKFNIA